jgi:hypothetical protein
MLLTHLNLLRDGTPLEDRKMIVRGDRCKYYMDLDTPELISKPRLANPRHTDGQQLRSVGNLAFFCSIESTGLHEDMKVTVSGTISAISSRSAQPGPDYRT